MGHTATYHSVTVLEHSSLLQQLPAIHVLVEHHCLHRRLCVAESGCELLYYRRFSRASRAEKAEVISRLVDKLHIGEVVFQGGS